MTIKGFADFRYQFLLFQAFPNAMRRLFALFGVDKWTEAKLRIKSNRLWNWANAAQQHSPPSIGRLPKAPDPVRFRGLHGESHQCRLV
jgi:hypothetical protein